MMNDNGTLKEDVKYLLCYGKENAITGVRLAVRLGYHSDREVRLAIRELIANGVPVASSVKPPYGYFIINTREEAEEYLAALRRRLIQDALRRRDIKRASRVILDPYQMTLV